MTKEKIRQKIQAIHRLAGQRKFEEVHTSLHALREEVINKAPGDFDLDSFTMLLDIIDWSKR